MTHLKNENMEYTREELIAICKDAKVLYQNWMNRDSHGAQEGVMMVGLLLESGCEFRVKDDTDERTIWLQVLYDSWENGETWQLHYLPTRERLEESKGKDWY